MCKYAKVINTLFLSYEELERLISEGLGMLDITTELLGIGGRRGYAEVISRSEGVLACVEEASKIYELCSARVTYVEVSGSCVKLEDVVLRAEGYAEALHRAWKVSQTLLAYCSGLPH